MVRKLTALAGMVLVLATCGDDDDTDPIIPPDPNGPTVSMPGFSFSPFTTNISIGGTVNFDFPSEPHNVIFDRRTGGAPTDIQATTNRVVGRVFPTAGTFPYDCTLHPGMSGQVVVR
jgi:plastocyanin